MRLGTGQREALPSGSHVGNYLFLDFIVIVLKSSALV